MKKTLILAIAAAGSLVLGANAKAGDVVMPPKAQEQADSLKIVSGNTPDMVDRSIQPAPPKQAEQAASLRTVRSQGPDIDLAHAPQPNLQPKDPNYDVALRQSAEKQAEMQVAPLK